MTDPTSAALARVKRVTPPPRRRLEHDTQTAILEYLRLRGVPCWRANSGVAAYIGKDGRARRVSFGLTGMADILGILPGSGRLLAIEVKAPKEHPTVPQATFLKAIREAGGMAFVAHALNDVARYLGWESPA